MAFSLLALIDDVAAMMDDVAVMTKVAAKKTAGVVGDDLAVNADQLNGISPEKELPIVWAVFKGSLKNKVILLPLAILISYFLPMLITPILMFGGAFLCYEGVEKVLEKFYPHPPELKPVVTEEEKVKGAIRTDLVLSAEILVISLGMIKDASITTQILSLSIIALGMTIGVYGFVALLIKLDDMGLYLNQKTTNKGSQMLGTVLLKSAPALMKFLGVAGTIAMFTVGGGIMAHGLPFLHSIQESIQTLPSSMILVSSISLEIILGVITGFIAVGVVKTVKKLKNNKVKQLN